ncbi:MAG: hypothetical protein GF329_12470 [Candidatus Lokiarchaeota archaeon]|nr:hypothetical protein [Candidatus Lokiarchaeota archaeon]
MTPSIYAQRLDQDGIKQWGSAGTVVYHDSTYWSMDPQVISDGSNGSIIIWTQDNSQNEYHILGQRLDSTGSRLWGTVKVIYNSGAAQNIRLCSDGAGGAYITWSYGDIYAQRISSNGNCYWASSGVVICDASATQRYPEIIKDNANYSVIVWEDFRNSNWDIYAQRINQSGMVQWTSNGISVCNVGNHQQSPQLTPDMMNGTYITWQDYRNSDWDIYSQRVNESGNFYWDNDGIPIANTGAGESYPKICSDGVGGSIIAWQRGDIYAQRLNQTGDTYWVENGSAICSASGTQSNIIMQPDGEEGAYIVWEDYRSDGWGDLYGYRTILPNKTILQPISPSTDTDGIIQLNWSESFGAAYYHIYRDTSEITSISGLDAITTTFDTEYSDIIPENGDYFYVIVASNSIANSSISNCENVTASVSPNAPNLYSIVPEIDPDGNILLNWSDEIAVTNYYIYRNSSFISDVSGLVPIASTSDTNYTDIISTNGMKYYVIVSENNLGNSSISNCEDVTIGIPPDSPFLDPILPIIDPDGTITLDWNNVTNATSYYIYRNSSIITTLDSLTPINTVSDSNYTDGLTINGIYYYVIVASDGWANSSISNCENVTIAIPPDNPVLDPILPTIDPDGTITLDWNNVTNAISYYIYRDTSTITTLDSLTPIDTVSDSNYTDTITTNGQYYYVIVASDGWANSSISNCENVTISIALNNPIIDPILPKVDSDGIINLDWNDVPNATLYYIYRDTTYITTVDGLIPVATVSGSNYTEIITIIDLYFYVVIATDGWANSSSISNCENVTIGIPPVLQTIVPEISNTGIISLNWTAINGANIYYIYRDTSEINSIENLKALTSSNSTNYLDSITSDGIYYYAIIASNGEVNSTQSNCESVVVDLPNVIPLPVIFPIMGLGIAVVLFYRKRYLK